MAGREGRTTVLILPVGSIGHRGRSASSGFILVEQVATLALIGLLILLAFPTIRPGTDQSRFRELLVNAAALLRDTRTDALARGSVTEVIFDRQHRIIHTNKHRVTVPADVTLVVLAGTSCSASNDSIQIVFRSDGTSCGGVFQFSLKGHSVRLRINWLTGHIETVQGHD